MDFMTIYVNMSTIAVALGQTFDCTAQLRNYFTGALVDSASISIAAVGDGSAFLQNLDYSNGSVDW